MVELFDKLRGKSRRQSVRKAGSVLNGQDAIKELSQVELLRLMRKAKEAPWSATGRPRWVTDRSGEIQRIVAVVFGPDAPSVYRCIVFAFTAPESAWAFTLDMAVEDFNELATISSAEQAELAKRFLYHFPMLDLDPEQEEAWDSLGRWRQAERDRRADIDFDHKEL